MCHSRQLICVSKNAWQSINGLSDLANTCAQNVEISQVWFRYSGSERKGEWWLVPDYETEVIGVSRSTFGRGPSFSCFVGLVMPVQEIFVLPWLLYVI